MKRENISDVRRSLEPSAEMKRRVMERAAKLEAGKKTFGSENATADNRQTFAANTKEKKENITMSINRSDNEVNKVKSHMPAAILSAAACAAIVIGIAAAGLRGGESELITDSGTATAPMTQTTADSVKAPAVVADSAPEAIMTVTQQDGSTYAITDKDRIAAIDALVKKAKLSHVWEGEEAPTERTLEYTLDGKQHIVKISEEQLSPHKWHPDNEPKVEICRVVTVDGESYAICEFVPDEPLAELYSATDKGGVIDFEKCNDNNYEYGSFWEEYNDTEDAVKLKGIIEDIRRNGKPQFEKENLYFWDEEHLPAFEKVRVVCDFKLDGNYYEIILFWDSDLIYTEVFDWHDGKFRSELCTDTQGRIAEIYQIFDSLKNEPEAVDTQPEEPIGSGSQAEDTHVVDLQEDGPVSPDSQKEELSSDEAKIPELFDLTEEQAVAALKEAGLNCIIGYKFNSAKKGCVFSYYASSDIVRKGSYIAVDISLGEYNGAMETVKPEHATGYYPTKESKLEVPVPDGLSGSYTFNIYFGGDAEYTNTVDDITGAKSVAIDVEASDKERLVVYAVKNGTEKEEIIRYATCEFDYATEKWTLIGELNTDGLLGTMK